MSDILVDIQGLRQQIDALCGEPNYDLEVFAALWLQYQQALESYCVKALKDQTFESILADNLQWVTLITRQVSLEKDAVAAKVLQLKKGKRAQQSYGDNN